jgi:hypothetical protein
LLSAFGVGTGTITRDDLHTRILAEPDGEDLGGPIVKQIYRPMRLEVG